MAGYHNASLLTKSTTFALLVEEKQKTINT
jgi:hypothetical protein